MLYLFPPPTHALSIGYKSSKMYFCTCKCIQYALEGWKLSVLLKLFYIVLISTLAAFQYGFNAPLPTSPRYFPLGEIPVALTRADPKLASAYFYLKS